ncbi:MAG: hypothetical protein JO202_01535 [Ktedonobacteraceae bacterium]|nr:hypothetical protein [Ktedonobacteraceae bacterium]
MQRRTRLALAWVCILFSILLSLGIVLLLMQDTGVLSTRGHDVEHTKLKTRATVPSGVAGITTPQAVHVNLDNRFYVRKLRSSNAWVWNTGLPDHRLLVFYGNPLSPVMGPIGQFSDDQLIAKLHEQAYTYSNLDPLHPVVPALDYVTPIVQPVPMDDKSWVYRMPNSSIEHYVDLANSNHALFFFDMQIGHSSVQKEVNLVLPYLERSGVDLALDPEFDMPPGTIPDEVFGRMKASEINWVIDTLSNLVLARHLPPKILILHRFLQEMLPDWQNIKIKPGVQLITCVDGFGTPGTKIDDYRMYDKEQLIQYPGMKLFYKLDKPLMSPSDVLALDPSPLMVMYQ